MDESLTPLLLSCLFAASGLAWSRVIIGKFAGAEPLWPVQDPDPPPLPASALVVGAGCLSFFLAGPVSDLLRFWQGIPAEPPLPIELANVQAACFADLVMTLLVLGGIANDPNAWSRCGFRLRALLTQVRDAVWGFHLAIGPVFAVLILLKALQLREDEPEHQFLRLLVEHSTTENWIWISLTAVMAAPLAEEIVFRVALQGGLTRWLPRWAAIGIPAILFCAVHEIPDAYALLPLALVLGCLYDRRRSYLSVVLVHAAFNAINLLLTALGNGG